MHQLSKKTVGTLCCLHIMLLSQATESACPDRHACSSVLPNTRHAQQVQLEGCQCCNCWVHQKVTTHESHRTETRSEAAVTKNCTQPAACMFSAQLQHDCCFVCCCFVHGCYPYQSRNCW